MFADSSVVVAGVVTLSGIVITASIQAANIKRNQLFELRKKLKISSEMSNKRNVLVREN